MREIERDRDGRNAGGREPLVAQVADGTERDAARGQFVVELRDARLQFAARDP